MSKEVDNEISVVSSDNESEVTSKMIMTKFLGSYTIKVSFNKTWGGREELSLVKIDIFSVFLNFPVFSSFSPFWDNFCHSSPRLDF